MYIVLIALVQALKRFYIFLKYVTVKNEEKKQNRFTQMNLWSIKATARKYVRILTIEVTKVALNCTPFVVLRRRRRKKTS